MQTESQIEAPSSVLGPRQKAWERDVQAPALRRAPDRAEIVTPESGLPRLAFYSPANVPLDYPRDLGFPGDPPYTRGLYPNGYRSQLWSTQQFAGFGTPEEANLRYRYLRSAGQEGYAGRANINIAFDLPTIYGYDSDDPLAENEVGRVGVAIDSARDMEILFQDFDLGNTFTSMVITGPALALFAFYVVAGERAGIPAARLSGVMQNDPLKAYIASKFFIFPPRPALRIVGDMLEFCSREMPAWNTIGVSGYHIREAGGNAVHELAFSFANALTYLEIARERGLDPGQVAARLSFFFEVGSDFFDEIAKLRAARRLWARLLQERFGITNPKALMLRCHCQTAGQSLTAQQPMNNVVRTAIQALAAILGGTQSLHTNSLDEALSLPSEEAVTVALRTQQVIAYETGVTDVVDPLGGSWLIEDRTNRIEQAVRDELERVQVGHEALTDAVVAGIERGYFHTAVAEAAAKRQADLESGARVIVGVNRFASSEETGPAPFRTDPQAGLTQAAKLGGLRSERDGERLSSALDALSRAAGGTENLVPFAIECARCDATLGEIIGALRGVFGEHLDIVTY